MRRIFVPVLLLLLAGGTPIDIRAQVAIGPAPVEVLRFAVIGDNGTGGRAQYEIGERLAEQRARSPFSLVLMLGDNFYGRQTALDLPEKFDRPYKPLLDMGVRFRAALGNHDDPETRFYPPLNMGGERYYTYAEGHVRFVVLDTNILDARQLEWAERVLGEATEPWKIAYFHHPLYSSGVRHGSNVELRVRLEPILVRHGVQVVFSGHDHAYERTKPQKGITYFVEGSSGQLRKGGLAPSAITAAGFDRDQTFMVVDIVGDEMSFQTISRDGAVVDSGVIRRAPGT